MTRDRAVHELPHHRHGAEPRVHERLHGEHAGRAAAAPLRDLQPGADRASAARSASRSSAPGNERTHLHLPSPYGYHNTSATWNMITHLVNKNTTCADGQHRGRVPLAARRRDRVRAAGMARHRLDLQRRELRVHDPDRLLRHAQRLDRAAERAHHRHVRPPARHRHHRPEPVPGALRVARARRSRSAPSCWAATATTTSGRSRPTTRRRRTSRARRCAGRRRITGPRSARRCARTATWTRRAMCGIFGEVPAGRAA